MDVRTEKTFADRLGVALATCGVGFIPFAPGTWGSAVGVGLYLLWRMTPFARISGQNGGVPASLSMILNGLAFLLVCGIGIWAAERCAQVMGEKDPQKVVVDEVMGQLTAFLFIPFSSSWTVLLAGFVLFRLFDIWKPYPIRKTEKLPSGFGICVDDIVAGVYAGIVLALLRIFVLS